FAAGGFALAVSLATRAEPPGDAAALRPPWAPMAETRVASHDVKPGAEESSDPAARETPPPSAPALSAPAQDSVFQLTLAQQMGRIEEKLRRAEEIADRQRESLQTRLTTFQQPAPAESEDPELAPPRPPDAAPLPAPPETRETRILPDEGDGRLVLNLRNSDLRQVLELLSEQHGLNIIASPTVQGAVTARLSGVTADAALDAVLKATGFVARREGNVIYVATPEEFVAIDHAHDRISTRVYRPNYITAAELEKLLSPIITPTVGKISVSNAAQVGIGTDHDQAGGNSFSGAEVVLVQDYESVLNHVDQLVLEVDSRPLQVAIEAMIITVGLEDENSFGVDLTLLRDHGDILLGTPANGALAGGLRFAFLGASVESFLAALEQVGDTNIVAAPRVMVLNKQRAEVHIGEDIGYLGGIATSASGNQQQSVEFLQVGTKLHIRPFISTDGMIRLEVHPELSSGTIDKTTTPPLPNKTLTQVTTNVMCRDGATVVLGGLIKEDLITNSTQIPVLGALPLVGAAFRRKEETLRRTETLVLLTPRIVSSSAAAVEGAESKAEYLRRQDVRYDKMNPFAQRYYGMQYARKARAAWTAGDADVALRYANLAIHFDPESLEAINLRTEIVETAGVGDRTVETHLREGLAPWGHPLREYSRLGLPWREGEAPTILVGEPPDPGVPGKIRNLDPPHPPHEAHPPLSFEQVYPAPLEEIPEVVIPAPLSQPR
ncbi:MAG: secretin and TonB N-terminal domain-containing protein, partial [Planctomycetes bacterium]|nr:secretin and TonB N-terminal domain-containing protein [Planctomycetota bacterium]